MLDAINFFNLQFSEDFLQINYYQVDLILQVMEIKENCLKILTSSHSQINKLNFKISLILFSIKG